MKHKEHYFQSNESTTSEQKKGPQGVDLLSVFFYSNKSIHHDVATGLPHMTQIQFT